MVIGSTYLSTEFNMIYPLTEFTISQKGVQYENNY